MISVISIYYGSLKQHIIYYISSYNEICTVDLENITKKSKCKVNYDWNIHDNSISSSDAICFKHNVKFIDDDKYFNVIFRTGYHVYYTEGDRIIEYSAGRVNALIWNIDDTKLQNAANVELPTYKSSF